MLYLDTSAVRALGKRLAQLSRPGLCTSALTIVELIAAATSSEGQLNRIRPALNVLLTGSPVSIDWRLPEAFQATTFEWIRQNCRLQEQRLESLKELGSLVVSSSSLTDFREREAAANLRFPVEYWREFDFLFGEAYIESSRVTGLQLKEAFERAKRGEDNIEVLGQAILDMTYPAFCRWFAKEHSLLNRSATIHALAHRLAADMTSGAPPDKLVSAIYETYDGSIDVFVDAFSWRSMVDHGEGRTAGRNDALDLAHFLAIETNAVLSTGDRIMGDTAIASGLKIISPDQLESAA